jgi:ubiquitin carboxyl-terminal hydrolase L5
MLSPALLANAASSVPPPPRSPPQEDDWLPLAASVIAERIGRYAAKEIRFNLMAVIRSRAEAYREELEGAKALAQRLQAQMERGDEGAVGSAAGSGGGEGDGPPSGSEALVARLAYVEGEVVRLESALAMEEKKREGWRDENTRRRTDYVPFTFNLLKALADAQALQPLLDAAQANKKAKTAGTGEGQG